MGVDVGGGVVLTPVSGSAGGERKAGRGKELKAVCVVYRSRDYGSAILLTCCYLETWEDKALNWSELADSVLGLA